MSKKEQKAKVVKQPKTIKLSTLLIAVAVIVAMVASFIGGVVYTNNYNHTIKAQAIELSKELKPQEQ